MKTGKGTFTRDALKALEAAQSEAETYKHAVVDMGHLLLGLSAYLDLGMLTAFKAAGLGPNRLREMAETINADLPQSEEGAQPVLSSSVEQALDLTAETVRRLQHTQVTPNHLLIGWLRVKDERVVKLLQAEDIDPEVLIRPYVRRLKFSRDLGQYTSTYQRNVVLRVGKSEKGGQSVDVALTMKQAIDLAKFLTDYATWLPNRRVVSIKGVGAITKKDPPTARVVSENDVTLDVLLEYGPEQDDLPSLLD